MAKKKQSNRQVEIDQSRDDRLELDGVIEEAMPGTLFKVRCINNLLVICTLGGRLRVNRIRILPGDRVRIEVSPYDTSRGRVVWRDK